MGLCQPVLTAVGLQLAVGVPAVLRVCKGVKQFVICFRLCLYFAAFILQAFCLELHEAKEYLQG